MLKYDFVLLVETFTETVQDSMFPSHKPFVSPGVKVSDSIHGRLSGGVVLLVRKELCEYVERIDVETDNIISLRLSLRLICHLRSRRIMKKLTFTMASLY